MYTIPFTEESVKAEICGRVLIDGLKAVGGHLVHKLHETLELQSDDVPDGIKWRVEGGSLRLLSEKDSEIAIINAVEVLSDKVFMSGECHGRVGLSPSRILLYERSELGTDFHVVISSHVDYENEAVPRLIRSLAMANVPSDRITVVVGGVKEDDVEKECKYDRIPVMENLMGLTGLVPLLDGRLETSNSYIVLLHDTCEANADFADKIKKTDVGLPYDIIESLREIGLWSMDFIKYLSEIPGFDITKGSTYDAYSSMKELSRLSCCCAAPRSLRSKDVYGTGTKREVSEISGLGVKKYSGWKQTGGRP